MKTIYKSERGNEFEEKWQAMEDDAEQTIQRELEKLIKADGACADPPTLEDIASILLKASDYLSPLIITLNLRIKRYQGND